jgi:DNA mismatch repair protein MutS
MPAAVVERARELLAELEGTHTGGGEGLGRHGRHRPRSEAPPDQLSMFQVEHPLVRRLRALNPDDLSPNEALQILYELGSGTRPRGDE